MPASSSPRAGFYAAHRDSFPFVTSLFHILDFSDKDIAEHVAKSNVDQDEFLAAVRAADATDEIRNPFIFSVMIEKYRAERTLSEHRSDNLSYMIDELIRRRPKINRHQQRRAETSPANVEWRRSVFDYAVRPAGLGAPRGFLSRCNNRPRAGRV